MILASSGASGASGAEAGLVAGWRFDEGHGASAQEMVSGRLTPIHGNFPREWVKGPRGSALRFDGYTTWLTAPLPPSRRIKDALTVEAWVAVPAYPVSDAAFAAQSSAPSSAPSSGWTFGLDNLGRWYLAASIAGQWRACHAEDPLPKSRWVHLAGTYDSQTGFALYQDGKPAGSLPATGEITPDAAAPLTIGKDPRTPLIRGLFPTGVLNGAMGEVKIYDRALAPTDIRTTFSKGRPGRVDLSIPASRYAGDRQRPAYHPIPDGAWTNEPHGLVAFGGTYHLFHQKNPDGPYWEQIHWGHLASRDLVHWEDWPIALAPGPGYDQRGVWSGDAVVDGDTPTIVYTGVDGVKAGVCLATSGDGGRTWAKHPGNPVIPSPPPASPAFADFRDPYVWREGQTWHLIIGSGVPDAGGTALHYTSPDLVHWTYDRPLMVGSKATSGAFWEMPIFAPIGQGEYILEVTTVEERAPARALYWIGAWKDGRFTPDSPEPRPLDVINHMLSPAVMPAPGGSLYAIGIVAETRDAREVARAGWAHAFSLARVLSLGPDGALRQSPAPALRSLRGPVSRVAARAIVPDSRDLLDVKGDQAEVHAVLAPGTAKRFGLRVRCSPDGAEQTLITYDTEAKALTLDRSRSSLDPGARRDVRTGAFALAPGETLDLDLFLDHSVLEVFVNGRAAFSTRIYPTRSDSAGIGLYASGGTARLVSLDAWPMKAAKERVRP